MMKDNKRILRAFGLWKSQITSDLMAASIGLTDPQWDTDGQTLVWREERAGKGVLMAQPVGQAAYELSGALNVRGGVGYGGGDFTIRDGLVVFAASDGRLYRRSLGVGFPEPITPAFGSAAAPQLSPGNRWVAFIHTYEGADVLAVVDTAGVGWSVKLAQGADFYMQPAWHPDGSAIAWIEWDHPNMPWDGTRLMTAVLEGTPPRIKAAQHLAGDDDVPILQPAFSPDGRYLSYFSNQGEWDQLVLRNLETGELSVLVDNATLLKPAWIQGLVVQAWSAHSDRIFFLQTRSGVTVLNQVDVDTGMITGVDFEPYTLLSQPNVRTDGAIALVASSPAISLQVISKSEESLQVHQRSTSEAIPLADLPQPYEIQWTDEDGATVYGIYSPPTSSLFQGKGLPPVIVHIHGGPTSSVMVGYDLEAAFFTNRGYGYLAVNYRGSTGYGRTYREALRGNWGDLDVVDAAGAARALVDQNLGDPGKLVIKGGSAGGYTVLNTLIRFPGLYKAGICAYGVTNLFTLAMDTHKFEARYTDSLVGPLPEAAQKYHAWSPVFHADKIKDPVIIFQGGEDKVVTPNQAEEIVEALRAKGVPHEYHLYPDEGHGFRQAETRRAYYQAIERFLWQYVVFSG